MSAYVDDHLTITVELRIEIEQAIARGHTRNSQLMAEFGVDYATLRRIRLNMADEKERGE